MINLQLFYEFFKVGLFSVGGGLATLPFLYDLADKMAWFSKADVSNMIAIAESTPGAIGVNMATYAGYTTAGIFGGIIATLGLVMPSIIIILIIARVLAHFAENKLVKSAFFGLRPASLAMIAAAGVGVCQVALLKNNVPYLPAIVLGIVLYILSKKTKLGPIQLIAIAGIIGVVAQLGI